MAERVVIAWLGGRGDGVAETAEGPLYVPGALPGETVLVERHGQRGRLLEVEDPSPDRVEPFCPYFGACGGCAAQHIGVETYASWKRDKLVTALGGARLEASVAELVDAHGEGRRRITLHGRRREGRTVVGYMAARSHDLVPIEACPIAEPALAGAAKAAEQVASRLRSPKPIDLQITATEGGLDIDVRGHGRPSDRDRRALVEAAEAADLARLSVHGDVVVERRPPLVRMGPTAVVAPPGGFLQATRAGEHALAEIVVAACGPARRIADLFSGCGPFALRLAARTPVHAVDLDADALRALERAARSTPGLRPVTTEARNLFQRPLLPPELDRFDAVIMDPPRAGADAQARQLAAAKVPLVVSVSCDAGTFARDAAVLVGAGYVPERIVPLDQFKYSPHLEIVGLFRKDAGNDAADRVTGCPGGRRRNPRARPAGPGEGARRSGWPAGRHRCAAGPG